VNYRAGFSLVWRVPEYRKYALCFLLLGATTSSAFPLVSIYLKEELGASNSQVGLFAVTGLASTAVSLSLGWLSDRIRSRSAIIRFALVMLATGWILLGLCDALWQAFMVGVIFFSVLGTVSAQLFASLSDNLESRQESRVALVTSVVRSGYSLGYVGGPVLGSFLSTAFGFAAGFFVTAGLYLLCGLLTRSISDSSPLRAVSRRLKARDTSWLATLTWLAAVAFLLSGDAFKSIYLPIYLVNGLGGSLVVFGTLMAVSAVCEIFLIPALGGLSDRFGLYRLMTVAIAIGVVDFAVLALSSSVWQLYVVQVIHVIVLGATLGLGPLFVQTYSGLGRGLASSVFFAGQSSAGLIAGLVSAALVSGLGLPQLFWLPAGFFLVATLILVARRRESHI
jgi:SET family sugar efflux transporter-like MFS transporter